MLKDDFISDSKNCCFTNFPYKSELKYNITYYKIITQNKIIHIYNYSSYIIYDTFCNIHSEVIGFGLSFEMKKIIINSEIIYDITGLFFNKLYGVLIGLKLKENFIIKPSIQVSEYYKDKVNLQASLGVQAKF